MKTGISIDSIALLCIHPRRDRPDDRNDADKKGGSIVGYSQLANNVNTNLANLANLANRVDPVEPAQSEGVFLDDTWHGVLSVFSRSNRL